MQGLTDEASVPTKYVIDKRILGVTMRRKIGTRTMPVPAEDLFPAKRARLQAPSTISTVADDVTTGPPDVTPTDPVNPAASLPSAKASYAPRRTWKGEEDAKLTEAVTHHGTHWVAVAEMIPGRTNLQCRYRWLMTLDPAIEKSAGKWTAEEDAKLTEAVKKYGNEWVKVAEMIPGRTNAQCRQRWTYTLDTAIVKRAGKWTPKQDAKLTEAIKKHDNHWLAVAVLVPGRTNTQCRKRWIKTLDPAIGKSSA
jgi:hypothetical protein